MVDARGRTDLVEHGLSVRVLNPELRHRYPTLRFGRCRDRAMLRQLAEEDALLGRMNVHHRAVRILRSGTEVAGFPGRDARDPAGSGIARK